MNKMVLLLNCANINHANNNGDTSLILASKCGNIELVRELLVNGANIDHANNNGDTSLILSTNHGCIEIVRELLLKGANINHANNNGNKYYVDMDLESHRDLET